MKADRSRARGTKREQQARNRHPGLPLWRWHLVKLFPVTPERKRLGSLGVLGVFFVHLHLTVGSQKLPIYRTTDVSPETVSNHQVWAPPGRARARLGASASGLSTCRALRPLGEDLKESLIAKGTWMNLAVYGI